MPKDKQTAKYKALEYLFDLSNVALENGFDPNECWEVFMATNEEKMSIEKQYHPTVATAMQPEFLNATFRLVKSQLHQAIKEQLVLPTDRYSKEPEYFYLLAYNPNRIRR